MVRKKILEIIEVPGDIKVEIDGKTIRASKDSEKLERKIECDVRKENNKLILECENATKREKKLIKTTVAHIRNLIKGLGKKFVYKLQICSVHFPMNVSVSGNELVIKNFLGETKERKAKILNGVEVKIEGDIIYVESSDKEKAGQTAANIEQATKVKNRDRRIFQDGIFIIEKEKGRRK